MNVIWSERALDRVLEIREFIANDKPLAAEKWVNKILDYPEQHSGSPKPGRAVPEFNDPNLREWLFGAYRIIFQINNGQIEILTVRRDSQLLHTQDLF